VGGHPPSETADFEQFHSVIYPRSTSETVLYTFDVGGRLVDEIQSKGDGSGSSDTLYWRYQLLYNDESSSFTGIHSKTGDGSLIVTDSNPFPWKFVKTIKVLARTSRDYYYYELYWSKVKYSSQPLLTIDWFPEVDRFGLVDHALKETANSFVCIQNHQSSYSSYSATYNFWLKFDSIPILGQVEYMQRGLFSCSLIPDGGLRFIYNSTTRDYPTYLQAEKWYMITIAGEYGGSTKFYVNGSEIGNTPDFGSYKFGADSLQQDLIIGGWDGAIDYAGFYDGQLTSPEILAIYEKENPKEVYHTVTQEAIVPAIAPENSTISAAGGTLSTELTLAYNVNWTASTNDSWISITSPTNGAGSTTVELSVDQNSTVYQRQGTVTIAGKTFTVDQSGLGAAVSDVDTVFGTDGGSVWVDVTTEGNALWQAVSQVSWLTVAIGESGSGAGSVYVVADPYNETSSSRIGAVIIAGHAVYFTQRGFELSVTPQVAQVGSNSGAGEFGVAAPIGAIWEAITTHSWISIVGETSGQGDGTVHYSVGANTTGASRTGRIIVAGQEYTITQLASLQMIAYTDGGGSVSGGGSYETSSTATLTATPDAGYVFSHWTGDAVGNDNPLDVIMDTSKTVKANFITQRLADLIAMDSKDRLELYNSDEMHDLALGNPVLEIDPVSRKMSVVLSLEQNQQLDANTWSNVLINAVDVTVEGGKVRVGITPQGDTAFYRLKGGTDE